MSQKLSEKVFSLTSNDATYLLQSDSNGDGLPYLRSPHKRKNGTICATAVCRGTRRKTLSHLFLRRSFCRFCPLLTSRTCILQPAYRHLLFLRLANLGGRNSLGVELEEDKENTSKDLGTRSKLREDKNTQRSTCLPQAGAGGVPFPRAEQQWRKK